MNNTPECCLKHVPDPRKIKRRETFEMARLLCCCIVSVVLLSRPPVFLLFRVAHGSSRPIRPLSAPRILNILAESRASRAVPFVPQAFNRACDCIVPRWACKSFTPLQIFKTDCGAPFVTGDPKERERERGDKGRGRREIKGVVEEEERRRRVARE